MYVPKLIPKLIDMLYRTCWRVLLGGNYRKPGSGTSVNNCMFGIKYLKNRTKKEVIIVSK